MPLYDYRCPTCGKKEEFLLDFDHSPPSCCGPMQRIYNAPAIHTTTFNDGFDVGAGRHFTSQRERDGWLKDNHLRRIT